MLQEKGSHLGLGALQLLVQPSNHARRLLHQHDAGGQINLGQAQRGPRRRYRRRPAGVAGGVRGGRLEARPACAALLASRRRSRRRLQAIQSEVWLPPWTLHFGLLARRRPSCCAAPAVVCRCRQIKGGARQRSQLLSCQHLIDACAVAPLEGGCMGPDE